MTLQDPKSDSRPGPELKLVIKRIQAEVLAGEEPTKLRAVLAQESLMAGAALDDRLELARLAQAAGEIAAARRMLECLTRDHPAQVGPWQALLDLLTILGDRGKLATALGAARAAIGEEEYRRRVQEAGRPPSVPADAGAATRPFECLRSRQEALSRYMGLFSGREDCFARQWANRAEGKSGYVPERRPFGSAELEEHLAGRKTYGIYLLQSDARVHTAVLDADLGMKFRRPKLTADDRRAVLRERHFMMRRIIEVSGQAGARPLIEFSGGKGFHFWYFFEPPAAAGEARRFLDRVRGSVAGDLQAFDIEVFPKQDALSGKGLGNLVKLPLGLHRLTGKRSFFIECAERSNEAQLAFLSCVKPVDAKKLEAFLGASTAAEVIAYPRVAKWAQEFPELFQLEKCCPPLGHLIAACQAGRTLSVREEKVLFHTVGFLPRAKTLLHRLLAEQSEYNPHLVDFKISRLRGSPLGCRRIHSLLAFAGDQCRFEKKGDYLHPLLHLGPEAGDGGARAEKIESLAGALENLKLAIVQLERFMK
jgi:hypothetical protein